MARIPDNVFEKIESVKEKLKSATEGLSDKQIQSILGHCNWYRKNRRKTLNEKEREVNELLLKNNIKPSTAYYFFLLNRAPAHIKQQIKDRKLSYSTASRKMVEWRKMMSTRAGKEIMEDMRKVIGGLQWKQLNQNLTRI